MKTPFQGETRGIMMSGDSPTPSAHGDHIYEMETVIGQPPNEKTTSDKAVQMSPLEFSCEPVGHSSRISHNTLAHHDSIDFDLKPIRASGDRRSSDLEDISIAEDITSMSPASKETSVRSEDMMRSDDIESVPDQVDSPPTPKFNVTRQQEEDSCLVNCLFYLDECCTCTIL